MLAQVTWRARSTIVGEAVRETGDFVGAREDLMRAIDLNPDLLLLARLVEARYRPGETNTDASMPRHGLGRSTR